MITENQVVEYANSKNYVPGTILWSSEIELEEEAFRSGTKSHAAIDFLRWQDIGMELVKGTGRIPPEEWGDNYVKPGRGISMFIKKILPEGMIYAGSGPATKGQKKQLKKDFDPLVERFWWQLEKGQPLPVGLELLFDGVPPGHCTLTVTSEKTVRGFLDLVSKLVFKNAGCDLFGIGK